MPLVRLTAAVLAATALTGCGGPGPVTELRENRLEITLDDFLIAPQNVRADDGRVTFVVTNRGRLGHNFRLRADGRDVVEITTLLPGEQATESADLAPGRYTMLCTVANHEELGMTARFVVR
jgi:plastocyanin